MNHEHQPTALHPSFVCSASVLIEDCTFSLSSYKLELKHFLEAFSSFTFRVLCPFVLT